MTRITVKPGDDVSFAGQILRPGVVDFTGYALTAHVRRKPDATNALPPLLTVAAIEWIDHAAGMFRMSFPREATTLWPVGAALVFDIRVADSTDTWNRTDTAEILTQQGITA